MKIVSANITGSLTLNNVDITTTVQSSSIWSGSFSTRVTSLESFSSSLDNTFATDAQLTSVSQSFNSSISILSGSLEQRITNTETTSSNLTTASGSFSTRVSNTEATASSLVNASSSFSTRVSTNETNISNLQTASGSFSTRVSSLETASGSFSTRVSTNETNISNLQNASSSFSTRVTSAESSITSIQGVTGSYATTGSNNFVGNQRISSTNNAIGFTSTASLYADGGLRVTKDAYISGTLYLNNLTVYGTQSVQYITASQLNISTNIISVNTDTPSIRYGGLSVYDSGSTGLTGSLLWDSEQNHWIYTNPSGSGYSGGMLISGPRASALGAEQGTTCNALMKGQGGDHITSSGIFDYGTCTSFYGNSYINSSGLACFNDTVCANTFKSRNLIVCEGSSNATIASSNNEVLRIQGLCQAGMFMSYMSGSTVLGDVGNSNQAFSSGDATGFGVNARGSRVLQLGTNQAFRVTIAGTGETTFACQVCSPQGIFSSTGYSNVILDGTNISGWGNNIAFKSQGTDFGYVGSVGSLIGNTTKDMTVWSTAGNGFRVYTNGNNLRTIIDSTGIACFSCQVCAPSAILTNSLIVGGTSPIYLNFNAQASCRSRVAILYRGTQSGDVCMVTEYGTPYLSIGGQENNPNSIQTIGFGFTNGTTYTQPAEIGFQTTSTSGYTCGDLVFATRGATTNTSPTERLRITSTGIACFSNAICAANIISSGTICTTTADGKNLDIGGVAVIRGNGSAYTTHYFTTGAVNVAKYLQYNASGVAVNQMAIDAHTYFNSGCNFGIGTTTPSYKLDISLPTTCTAVVARFNSPSYDEVHISAGLSNYIGTNSTSAFSLRTTNTNRLTIAGTGEATFSCQVCLKEAVYICGTFPRLILDRSVTSAQSDIKFVDAGTSVWSIGTAVQAIGSNLDFYNYSLGGNVLKLTTTGEACFKYTVCAPQYITTQGSSVSYAAGTNYIVWSSEGEVCACDTNTGGTYTTMKTWVADRTGCLTLRFAGYIQSGPTYFAWRVTKNGTSSLVCGYYIAPLAPGCSTSVHAYTTFQSDIGPVNPGDCIALQMVSSNSGGTPINGAGQFLFAKELRLHSTTPNFSAGSPNNVFGDWVGIGTATPVSPLHINAGAISNAGTSKALASFRTCSNIYFDICQANAATIAGRTITGTTLVSSDDLAISTLGSERLRITSTGIACFACQVCAPLGVFSSAANNISAKFRSFGTGVINCGASCLVFTDSLIDKGLYLISIGSSIDSTFGYSGFLWVNTGAATIASTIRQACVSLSFSGRNICVTNQYTLETAVMNINLIHLSTN